MWTSVSFLWSTCSGVWLRVLHGSCKLLFKKLPSLSRVDKGILSCKSLTTTALCKGSYQSWFVTYNKNVLLLIPSSKKKRNFVFRLSKIKGSDMLFFVIIGQGPICWLCGSATNKCAWVSLIYLCSYIIQFRILYISGSSMILRTHFFFSA